MSRQTKAAKAERAESPEVPDQRRGYALLTQWEFTPADFKQAERLARRLGYKQTAYTSTSALWGLFCLRENPQTWKGPKRALQGGCIISTRELGLLFVQDLEDLGFED